MIREDIKDAIEKFFFAIDGDFPVDARLSKLGHALDCLALAVHHAEYTIDERDFPDAEIREYSIVREIVLLRFPELGYYNVALDVSDNLAETSLAVGDAIDDICDISRDLEETLWRWNNTSVDDALWYFSLSYGWHWGRHLRNLQLYLHDRQM